MQRHQDLALVPSLTVRENVRYFAALYGMGHVQQQFFPSSDRTELLVDLTLPQNDNNTLGIISAGLLGNARDDPSFAVRAEREVACLQQLKHPHIVQMLDYGIIQDHPFFTMTLAEASAMKLYSARAATEVAMEAVQLFGGNGYMSEFQVEQLARDSKVLQIYAGTDEIQITHIAKDLLRR